MNQPNNWPTLLGSQALDVTCPLCNTTARHHAFIPSVQAYECSNCQQQMPAVPPFAGPSQGIESLMRCHHGVFSCT